MKTFVVIFLLLAAFSGEAQRIYPANQYEFIFSMGNMNSSTPSSDPVVRFSVFFKGETQLHIDFSKSTGIYTGIGIKNIGVINKFDERSVTFKQRAYAINFPFAFKLGNMQKQAYVAIGAEANLMTHYKEKLMYDDTKVKKSEWFSNKVNIFNPAVFLQFKFMKKQVITLKYYLDDFLKFKVGAITLPDGTVVTDHARSSKLFSISFGSNIAIKSNVQKQLELQNIKSAKWVE